MSFKPVNGYGLDAELARKRAAQYDKELEERIQVWIEEVTGITFDQEFGPMLKNGIVLCELVNVIMPGKIKKINKTGGLFRMQENVTKFIRVCRSVGVPEASLFPTESLAQLKDLNQVLVTINAFSNTLQRRADELGLEFNGPWLGGDMSEATKAAEKERSVRRKTNVKKRKSKWEIKPGGSGGISLLNQGSAAVMERQTVVNAREEILRNKLGGGGAQGEVSKWNQGSSKMERLTHVDAREQIKRNELDGKGTDGEVSALNQGSAGMERLTHVDPREAIKRGEL